MSYWFAILCMTRPVQESDSALSARIFSSVRLYAERSKAPDGASHIPSSGSISCSASEAQLPISTTLSNRGRRASAAASPLSWALPSRCCSPPRSVCRSPPPTARSAAWSSSAGPAARALESTGRCSGQPRVRALIVIVIVETGRQRNFEL